MINDLSLSTNKNIERTVPICIIGAGTVGIFLAQQLRRQGLSVLVLESGSNSPATPKEMGYNCFQQGIRYRGADSGRSFGLGGTSVLWGGQMIPLLPSDMTGRSEVGISGWPINHEQLTAYFPSVKKAISLPSDQSTSAEQGLKTRYFSDLSQFGEDFQLRLSQWIPFGSRNFAQAFSGSLHTDPKLEIWLNATVVNLNQSPDKPNQISAIHARSPQGHSLTVHPQIIVICAGTLESTRIMLALDETSQGLITQAGSPLGRYFTDHLSVTCGKFTCHNWRKYNIETAPIFDKGIMRTPRLEVSPVAQKNLGLTSAFAHFTFITRGETGFDVVRNLLRKRQGEKRIVELKSQKLASTIGDISAMAFWRGAYNRLYIPRQADLLLQVDIEQFPNWDSCIKLADEQDNFGRKRLIIDWKITPEDIRVVRTVAERVMNGWNQSRLSKAATLHLSLPEDLNDFESLYDVYHPTGTLRMGTNPADSIVNPDLRVWSLDNVYLSTTAVFPSAGSANPGLTHLALTARLANHLTQKYF